MPRVQIFRNSYLHQLSPDNQTASLAPLDLAFAALPPKERARVIDLGRTRYGVPAQAAPPVNVERLNDSLTPLAVNLPQNLALGAPRGLANIAPTGTDLTGLIYNLFDTDLGDRAVGRLAGGGAADNVLAGAALAVNHGPQSALEVGSTGARLGKAREEAGRLAAVISQ